MVKIFRVVRIAKSGKRKIESVSSFKDIAEKRKKELEKNARTSKIKIERVK